MRAGPVLPHFIMAIRSDKNIEALRIGIAEQERKRLDRERIDALLEKLNKRERIEGTGVKLVPVIALLVGDRLAATDDGTSFYVSGTVRRLDRKTEAGKVPAGDWWVSVDNADSGSSGRAFNSDQRVLIVDADENAAEVAYRKRVLDRREEERYVQPKGGVTVGCEITA